MSKKSVIENKSTKLFIDLACRSFDANWKAFQEANGESSERLDDSVFISLFLMYVIDHIKNNFVKFTTQEGDCGNINEVNFEQVAVVLVWHTERFRK
ncbi:hypothetical protein ACLLS5_000564 [Salmonella enterica]|uniref:Uncharacterized protein n=3 Tax=Salmonella enterica TaxID=28901 RepID=A0A379SWT2_SALER|nr:hypothetical protein [Salmonella enterica]EAN8394028.1 hypothetical protein [Salmonella enterica subsp. arizonae serovar 13,23:gz51:-]EAV7066493.1 hypothetical protein [Salmonella enterica subsp. arizonae serovar 63:z36:-]EBD1260182.1 hypothetical protein [Salmonella enterica subsp. arizonae serovar 62:z4,z32:-]EBF3615482.1 hypothetical protein [Salmonella enterica subsp. arizonae serovar [1],13,23:g,z51:-]EBH9979090.1 hypothetical protein [Salmonella enterica subsp. arizonae serovar 40:z36